MTSKTLQCGTHAVTTARIAILLVLVFGTGASSGLSGAAEPAVTSGQSGSAGATSVGGDPVAAVETRYRDLTDLTAKVVQKNFLRSVEKTQTFNGTLSIKRPGKLRLEYTNGQTIVIDGKEAWFYSRKSQQAIRRTFKDFEQANIPVAFLLGAGAIRQDFDITLPEGALAGTLDLAPKRQGAAMQKLRLFTAGEGRITRMTVYDRSGNTSDVQFSEVREGTGLDDARFRFKIPKGTEIIEQ